MDQEKEDFCEKVLQLLLCYNCYTARHTNIM